MKVSSYRSSQFFNNISDVEKQASGAWIYVLIVKVTIARSWRKPTFWNYSIIVRMVTTSKYSHLQSGRIPQWWSTVSVCRQKLSDVVFTELNRGYSVCGDSFSINIVSKCFQRSYYMIFSKYRQNVIFLGSLLLHIARIMVVYLHNSFAEHIVLLAWNNWSPEGSLEPFYSYLGYGLLNQQAHVHLKRHEVDNHLFFNFFFNLNQLR